MKHYAATYIGPLIISGSFLRSAKAANGRPQLPKHRSGKRTADNAWKRWSVLCYGTPAAMIRVMASVCVLLWQLSVVRHASRAPSTLNQPAAPSWLVRERQRYQFFESARKPGPTNGYLQREQHRQP